MKTIKITGTLLLIVFASTLIRAQEKETPPLTLEKISGNIYQILGKWGCDNRCK